MYFDPKSASSNVLSGVPRRRANQFPNLGMNLCLDTPRSNPAAASLVELGLALKPSPVSAPYKTGMFFLHRQLGYRGVVVKKWTPKVFSFPNISSNEVAAASLSESPKHVQYAAAFLNSSPPQAAGPRRRGRALAGVLPSLLRRARRPAGCLSHPCCWRPQAHDSAPQNCGLGIQSWTHESGLAGDVDYVDHDDIIPFLPNASEGFRNGLHALYFRRRSPLLDELVGKSPLAARDARLLTPLAVKYHEKHVLTGDYYSWEQLTQKSIGQSRVFRCA